MKKNKFYILLICLFFIGISLNSKFVYAASETGTEYTKAEVNENNSMLIASNGNIEDDANLVYLIDQFYNNAWNKMLIVITALITFVGVGFPILFEYIRNKKNNTDIQQFKDSKKEYIDSVTNINKRLDEISKEVDTRLSNALREIDDKKSSVDEDTSVLIEQNKEFQDRIDELTSNVIDLKNENSKLYNQLKYKNLELMKDILEGISETVTDENSKMYITDKIVEVEKQIEDNTEDKQLEMPSLSIQIDGNIIKGNTVKEFYRKIIEELINNNVEIDNKVPSETGKIRYLINFKNEHVNGSKFTAPIKVGKYYLETHKSKTGAYNDMLRFLKKFNDLNIVENDNKES